MSLHLSVYGVEKSYGGDPVLKGCSLSLDRSGIYVLTGANGSGKSTLLRVCALLEEPDRGTVEYSSGGIALAKNISLRRRVTLVLPRAGVFSTTVFNNAAYGLKIRKMERRKIDEKVNDALDFVGLKHKAKQDARTLSSGETQRLGLARALVTEPEMLFLDEPTSSVDPESTTVLEGSILSLGKESGKTIVVTTHDKEQAQRLADFLLIMERGRVRRL
ncbi:MAG: ATP-binding cassette domain-containing protein [Alphaproteobacteria bacterium]|uniref:ATP-binding cassette domain-containing protein n=1 Tax=Candidatus Nitrobium versatile TaxID=2884831 RepID=A0A953JEU3_9BACT|nr:ATP-binding cassette domain-containing protein [Candidatus Nitrobium versatile]